MDSVGAALTSKRLPKMKSIAGLNQNYAWGQDSWSRLQSGDENNWFPTSSRDVADAQAVRQAVQRRNLDAARRKSGRDPFQLYDGDLEPLPGRTAWVVKEEHGILTTGETAMWKLAAQIPDGTILGPRPAGHAHPTTI
jgi:branched-chain amino acid transport system substrate-binding protein